MPRHRIPAFLRANAKKLRRTMTNPEKRLWWALRAHRLEGIAFRRQLPIGAYIVDFAAPEYRLIIELDGSQHAEETGVRTDSERDARLTALGWTVLRFWNNEVLTNMDGVCATILAKCADLGKGEGQKDVC